MSCMIEDYEISLLDTNILIYSYDASEKEKHEIAKKILNKCWKREMSYALSTQNLSEFFINVTKKIKYPLTPNEIKENIKDIISFSHFKILTIKPISIPIAIEISTKFNLSYWDALIAATMQENSVFTIITENDKDFKKIPWLTVKNPFK